MRKRQVEIGTRFGNLTVIAQAGSDHKGNQLVRVRCDCPEKTELTVRLTDLTLKPYSDERGKLRKPRQSCGCAAKRAYRDYWDRRARKFRKCSQRTIWEDYQVFGSFAKVAKRRRLPVPLVSAVCRVYEAKNHPKPHGGAIPYGSKAYFDWKDDGGASRTNATDIVTSPHSEDRR
jgi:hypothetical protein